MAGRIWNPELDCGTLNSGRIIFEMCDLEDFFILLKFSFSHMQNGDHNNFQS